MSKIQEKIKVLYIAGLIAGLGRSGSTLHKISTTQVAF